MAEVASSVCADEQLTTAAGVTCAPIRVEVPQLDDNQAAAAAAASGGIQGSTAAAAAAPSSWHQLWGAGAYQDVMPNAAAGSFLLGELAKHFVAWLLFPYGNVFNTSPHQWHQLVRSP
jgi:hypothetical protein